MLILSPAIEAQLRTLAAEAYPLEGCGLLLGHADGNVNRVEALYPVPNEWEDPEERRVRFRISSQRALAAELAAAGQGLDVVGVYHSHPDHPPVASPRDLAWASWRGYSYVITEVRNGEPAQIRSWQLLEDGSGFGEEEIRIDRNTGPR